MIKVQILIPCEHCSGQAFLPVGEEVGYTGKHYIRYRPCPQCQGSGNQPKWVDLRNFANLVDEAKLTDKDDLEILLSRIAT